jgi:hypothetical protein
MLSLVFSGFAALAGLAAFLGWLVAAVHAFLLLGHVAPPHTKAGLLFQGHRFFRSDTFLPSGQPLQKRMLIGMLVFFGGAVSSAIFGVLAGALA